MEPPSSYSQMSEVIGELYTHTLQGAWGEVVKLYKTEPEVWSEGITSSGDTALHMVINEDNEDVVAALVEIIATADDRHDPKKVEALMKANEVGDTLLHRAAARGSVEICECIVEAAKTFMSVEDLLKITNKWGENPIFISVLDNRKHVFLYLLRAARKPEDELLTAFNGDTVLHRAIRREHYELAFHIMQLCPSLVGRCNEKGITPLHILASKPSAFRSGYHLSWWQSIIYYCISVDSLKFDDSLPSSRTLEIGSKEIECPDNYWLCSQILSIWRLGREEDRDLENHYDSHVKGNVPQNYATWFQFLFMALKNLFWVLRFGKTFDEIIKARRTHTWSVQILDELMKNPKAYMTKDGSHPGTLNFGVLQDLPDTKLPKDIGALYEKDKKGDENKDEEGPRRTDIALLVAAQKGVVEVMNKILERLPVSIHERARTHTHMAVDENKDEEGPRRTDTALLVAAQKGVVEVVNQILERLPVSIHDTSSKKKNIVLVATENRQPPVLDALYNHLNVVLKKPKLWRDLVRAVDADGNTILHLAAKYDEAASHPWQIHGAAMQMQWEIKWYEHVKSFLPSHFIFLANNKDETPEQIFSRGHQKLVQSSSDWLKDTSESCSVVAALVAGVSFATSTTVPGGTDEQTGKPNLEGQPAFELFAVTALIGLCFSVTALIMFLSILTSRKQYKDFKADLPLKLLLGLSSLFVSIATMLISFCAAHFFVLEDKFKKGVFPLYAATCLPASFYAIAQFPLYMALLKATVRRVPGSHRFGYL